MVNLDSVQHEASLSDILGDVSNLKLGPPGTKLDDETDAAVSVYGSKFAAQGLPSVEIPEATMPKEIAYRMIKDALDLDGTPSLNLASFVTTYMEEEAEKLMVDAFNVNAIDVEEYNSTADLQNRCINMIAHLFNVPTGDGHTTAMGTSTIGSSEAIMLATLAMKKIWVNKRKAEGKDYSKPNLVMSSAVQVCWEKSTRYFEVDEKYGFVTDTRYVLDPKEAVDLCDENTIGICAILGTTYTGEYEDVKAINDLLIERKLDVPIHVDAASGGFVAPFVTPDLVWDFRLEKVVSINVSGHKYGLVYPGIGWCVWRDSKFLPKELIFNINYLGADQASFTLNFSRGASQIVGQYYQLIRLGKQGYRHIMVNLTMTADYLSFCLEKLGFVILSQRNGKGLPLVAFKLDPKHKHHFDEFAVAHQLRERSWVVPAYTMAPHSEKLKLMRVVIREDFSRAKADMLVADVHYALETLKKMNKEDIQQKVKQHKAKLSSRTPGKVKKFNQHFTDEKHSLQGKHGKTHAVC